MKRILTLLIPALFFLTITIQAQVNNPWLVPKDYHEMNNPVKPDKESVKEGKKLYKTYCMSCHGEYGHGDGVAAINLNVDPSDLTFDDIDSQTDGDIFYKIKTGKDEMHTFSNTLDENAIWNLVNYIRTLYPKEE